HGTLKTSLPSLTPLLTCAIGSLDAAVAATAPRGRTTNPGSACARTTPNVMSAERTPPAMAHLRRNRASRTCISAHSNPFSPANGKPGKLCASQVVIQNGVRELKNPGIRRRLGMTQWALCRGSLGEEAIARIPPATPYRSISPLHLGHQRIT